MDPEQKIDELVKIVTENQKTLKKMHKHLRFQTIIKTTYWIVVILGLIGAYFFLRPTYQVIRSNLNEIKVPTESETAIEDYNNFKPLLTPNGTFLKAIKNFLNLN